ncbi:MAG: Uncharacterised protein [Flavobacteriaceae bacterium]|nr:MAG: Uncharacterised protein [Flavobacteriaceae bacterium]
MAGLGKNIYKYKATVLFLLIACLFFTCDSQNEGENQTGKWDAFVEFREGNIPLILVAAHGGDLKPNWINDRDCPGSKRLQDQYTLGIALQLEKELQELGFQPYMILAKIHRIKIDLNRSLSTSVCDDTTTNSLWRLFHEKITAYSSSIENTFGRGLLIDIHGQSHPIQRIELGYLLNGEDLRTLQENPEQFSSASVSIRQALENHPQNMELEDLLTGPRALGTLLEEAGFPSVPSASDTAPAPGDLFFSGGHNTQTHGSRDQGMIDAIQLELNREGLRNESANRQRFSERFANILVEYLEAHYSDVF